MVDPASRAAPAARYQVTTTTIRAGQSLSDEIDCGVGAPVMIHVPQDWTSSRLTFQISTDGTIWADFFDRSSLEVAFNVTAGTAVLLETGWAPVLRLKIRSGGRDAPVPQEADRVIGITLDTTPP